MQKEVSVREVKEVYESQCAHKSLKTKGRVSPRIGRGGDLL